MKPLKIKAKHPPLLYEGDLVIIRCIVIVYNNLTDILGEGTKPHSSVPSIRSHLPVTSSTPDTSHHVCAINGSSISGYVICPYPCRNIPLWI